MPRIFVFAFIFVPGEISALFIFKTLNILLLKQKWELKINLSVIKGNLERLFLFLSLIYGVPHGLIAFGAIKIGTRIKPDEKITNDYFFIGNMISLLISVCYFAVWRHFITWH